MRNSALKRVAATLIFALLLLGQIGPVSLAYVEPEEAFTVRITPPAVVSGESAAVEIRVTDNAGDGFKSVQVRKGKNQTWQLITSDMEKRENRYYGSTVITENCTVYVRVTGNSGKFYESSKYIECFGISGEEQPVSASTDPDATPDTAPRSKALTPDGAASVLDNATSEDGKEFFTFTTPAENVFYLVIDKQRQDKNVYFLNAVTEKDLMALAQTDAAGSAATPAATEPKQEAVCICTDKCAPGAVNADCPVCVLSWKNCKGVAHDHDGDADGGDTQPPQPQRTGMGGGSLAVMLVVVLGAGGAGYYFKIYKPKKELENAEDLDELTGGADEETVSEDEREPSDDFREAESGESDYQDYPDYGDEPEYPEDGE